MREIDVVCIGQALLDCITKGITPYKKNVFRAENIQLCAGGDALNEASILRKLGRNVKLVCGVGEDIAGNVVLDIAKKRDIDVSNSTQNKDLITPVANLMVDKDGNRISYNSPSTMLGNYSPDPKVVIGAKIVSLASIFRAPFDTKENIFSIIKAAKSEGCIICVDTKLPTYRNISIQDVKEILPMIDFIFPNENEAVYMTGKTDHMEMAETLHKMGIKNVILKAGKKGCVVCNKTEKFYMNALDVNVVDSTGAGDSFVAGFINSLLDGKNIRECCELGISCAAECIQHLGAY